MPFHSSSIQSKLLDDDNQPFPTPSTPKSPTTVYTSSKQFENPRPVDSYNALTQEQKLDLMNSRNAQRRPTSLSLHERPTSPTRTKIWAIFTTRWQIRFIIILMFEMAIYWLFAWLWYIILVTLGEAIGINQLLVKLTGEGQEGEIVGWVATCVLYVGVMWYAWGRSRFWKHEVVGMVLFSVVFLVVKTRGWRACLGCERGEEGDELDD